MTITSKVLLFIATNGSKFDNIAIFHTKFTEFSISNKFVTRIIRFKEEDSDSYIFDIVNKTLAEIQ